MQGKQLFVVNSADERRLLVELVLDRLCVDRPAAERRIREGAVYVDGRRVRDPARPLQLGERVTVYQPRSLPDLTPQIAFRDADVVVLDKPAGLPSVARREGGLATVEQFVREHLGREARLLHRLDAGASGLLLVSVRARTRPRLAEQVQRHRLQRRYFALVDVAPQQDEWTIAAPLAVEHGRARASSDPRARAAETLVRVLRRAAGCSLLQVELRSGRTHQIRAHLAEQGLPLVGDVRYGGRPDVRLALHAHCLQLQSPAGDRLEVHSPLPVALRSLLDARPEKRGGP